MLTYRPAAVVALRGAARDHDCNASKHVGQHTCAGIMPSDQALACLEAFSRRLSCALSRELVTGVHT